jgi:hypothetical protein
MPKFISFRLAGRTRNTVHKLPELQSETDTLIAFHAGRRIFIFQIMLYPVNPFFKIDGPGVSFLIPVDD